MSKDKIADYDGTTAGNNTDIGGISIAEGMLPSAVNNSMRELTKQLGAFANGTDAIDALDVTGAATVGGAFTSPGIDDNANANAITIDSSENVGIGVTSMSAKTVINQPSSSDALIIQRAAGVSGNTTFSFPSANSQIAGTNHIILSAGGSERLRILDSGGLDLSAGNLVLDNGYGIDFSATANSSGTVTHEILDDYEIGTFTPHFQMGLTSPGYSVQQGTYVKIGSLVVCSIYLRANSGTENGDHIYVGGLPFTVITGGSIDHQYGAFFTYNGGFWTSDANTQWLALKNQTNLAFYKQADGGAIQGTTSGVATNLNADLRLVAVYRA